MDPQLKETVYETFRAGSKTYYNSSKYFPEEKRDDVAILYAFVRIADNFVDAQPQDAPGFHRFKDEYLDHRRGGASKNPVIQAYVDLSKRYDFPDQWSDAFLQSMEWDLSRHRYETIEELKEYIYGSADVIGLFMARILQLSEESYGAAEQLGSAMQLINFVRDVAEDIELGRHYLPMGETRLSSLNYETVAQDPEEFKVFMRRQVDRYLQWQKAAEAGFHFLPKKLRIAIETASEMYKWTAQVIAKDPMVVYRKKVKPSKIRIFLKALSVRLKPGA